MEQQDPPPDINVTGQQRSASHLAAESAISSRERAASSSGSEMTTIHG
jgi:hypothetical protein